LTSNEISFENDDDLDELYENTDEIYYTIQSLYQILNYQARGSYFPYQCAIIDNIINPLLLDQDFKDIDVTKYM